MFAQKASAEKARAVAEIAEIKLEAPVGTLSVMASLLSKLEEGLAWFYKVLLM